VTVDAAEVARIAAALGVPGEPVAADPQTGNAWRVGPDDGSAPALFVASDGLLSWYYSPAWATTPVVGCAVAGSAGAGVDDVDVAVDVAIDVAEVPPGTGDVAVDVPADTRLPVEECPEPEPPVGVPTAEQAEARVRELLAALGEDAAAFQFETYADEWSASVTAYRLVDGLRWPLAYGFGFGAEGALQWASGSLAEPIPTGPYPLVDLDTALARLGEQNAMWGYGGTVAIDARAAEETAAASTAAEVAAPETPVEAPVDDQGDAGTPAPDEITETPEPIVATLVDVRADFWWVWDTDNSVWLLPAYTFTDADGIPFTIPAVTDDYMIVVEPVVEPLPEPMPAEPVDPVVVDPPATEPAPGESTPPAPTGTLADLEALVGVPLPEFEDLATRFGYTTRVARVDGVDQALTMDYSESRVNVAVEGDIVTEIVSIG
jgi:hypothetical protein